MLSLNQLYDFNHKTVKSMGLGCLLGVIYPIHQYVLKQTTELLRIHSLLIKGLFEGVFTIPHPFKYLFGWMILFVIALCFLLLWGWISGKVQSQYKEYFTHWRVTPFRSSLMIFWCTIWLGYCAYYVGVQTYYGLSIPL